MSRVRTTIAPISAALLLIGCGDSLKTKDKVQAAIVERLQSRTGLDMSELDVSTTSVRFDKDLAYATVAIHPKSDANVKHGMSMQYTLQEKAGRWVVLKSGSGHAGPTPGQGAEVGNLPPGHPAVNPDQHLLPGHPPMPDRAPMQPDGGSNPGSKGPTQ